MCVIQVSSLPNDKPPVIMAKFESLRQLYFPEIGLYSKPRPWIVNNDKTKQMGIKVVQDGIPRSSKAADSDFTNEDDIFHRNHKDFHQCNLNKDGRVIKKYRKPITVKKKNYICDEIDTKFLNELFDDK